MAEGGPCLPYEKAIRSVFDMGDVDHGTLLKVPASQPVNESAKTKTLSGERRRGQALMKYLIERPSFEGCGTGTADFQDFAVD